MEGLLLNAHPSALELRHAYAQWPFSVFAVSRQIKLPGECAHYSTIHSAMIFPVRDRARFALGGECLEGRHGVVLHGCPHKDLLFGAVGDEPFEHINVYYEANSDETGDPHHWMMRPFDFVPDNYDELMVRVEALEALNAAATLDSRLNQIVGATNLLRTMFDPSPRTRADERMARARAYIETHFAELIAWLLRAGSTQQACRLWWELTPTLLTAALRNIPPGRTQPTSPAHQISAAVPRCFWRIRCCLWPRRCDANTPRDLLVCSGTRLLACSVCSPCLTPMCSQRIFSQALARGIQAS